MHLIFSFSVSAAFQPYFIIAKEKEGSYISNHSGLARAVALC